MRIPTSVSMACPSPASACSIQMNQRMTRQSNLPRSISRSHCLRFRRSPGWPLEGLTGRGAISLITSWNSCRTSQMPNGCRSSRTADCSQRCGRRSTRSDSLIPRSSCRPGISASGWCVQVTTPPSATSVSASFTSVATSTACSIRQRRQVATSRCASPCALTTVASLTARPQAAQDHSGARPLEGTRRCANQQDRTSVGG